MRNAAWLAMVVAVALAAACSSDSPKKATPSPDQQVQATATALPLVCPVDQAICDFALEVEKPVQARDYAAIAETAPGIEAGVRQQAEQAIPDGTPKLVSIGCPFGAVDDSCEGYFSLIFTTLAPADDWTGSRGIFLLMYERANPGPRLRMVNMVAERGMRRAALAGGIAQGPCNFSGIAPGQSEQTCSRSFFYSFTADGKPFIPVDVQPANPFVVLSPGPLPTNSVLFVTTGCWGCEGYDTAIKRIITDAGGNVTTDDVPEPPLQAGEQRTQFAMLPDASVLVAVTCRGSNCGPLGVPSVDIQSRVLSSRDGGYTWEDRTLIAGAHVYVRLGPGGELLLELTHADRPPEGPPSWRILDGPVVTAPAGTTRDYRPMFLADGSIGWWGYEEVAILRGDGSDAFRMKDVTAAEQVYGIIPAANGTYLVRWQTGGLLQPGSPTHGFWSLVRPDGTEVWRRETTNEMEFWFNAMFDEDTALANIAQPEGHGQLPALVDFDAGTVQPFGDPFGTTIGARNSFLAMVRGPYATVNAPGDCLNVRETASLSAGIVVCAKHGALLGMTGETSTAGGIGWVGVRLLDGREGWASAEFIE